MQRTSSKSKSRYEINSKIYEFTWIMQVWWIKRALWNAGWFVCWWEWVMSKQLPDLCASYNTRLFLAHKTQSHETWQGSLLTIVFCGSELTWSFSTHTSWLPQPREENMPKRSRSIHLEATYTTSAHVYQPKKVTVPHLTLVGWESAKLALFRRKMGNSQQPWILPFSSSFTFTWWPRPARWQLISVSTFHSLVDSVVSSYFSWIVERPLCLAQQPICRFQSHWITYRPAHFNSPLYASYFSLWPSLPEKHPLIPPQPS